ncbi:MAG: DNA repair protein RecO [Gammaproteobacteria bacterium]|nr:DNA repair protein RecO [Gammaproteobacteria bacterium]
MRVTLQPAFVLHTKPFRDTSLLVELLTLQYGRVSVLAHGARSAKSKLRGLLLPFVPLLVAWSGKTELMTLGKIEINGAGHNLLGNNILSGFYLNELLLRLLARLDSHPKVFHAYETAVNALDRAENVQLALRLFEKELLQELGYGLHLTQDVLGKPIDPDFYYRYEHERGFVKCEVRAEAEDKQFFAGSSLLALQQSELLNARAFSDIKRLMRLVFAGLLGDRPLKSRECLC